MKFRVTRTSSTDDSSPCNNAHSLGDGDDWYIELETLEDLVLFMKSEEGRLVLQEKNWVGIQMPTIEIYDFYRE